MGIYKGNFDVEMLVTRLHNKFTGGGVLDTYLLLFLQSDDENTAL